MQKAHKQGNSDTHSKLFVGERDGHVISAIVLFKNGCLMIIATVKYNERIEGEMELPYKNIEKLVWSQLVRDIPVMSGVGFCRVN